MKPAVEQTAEDYKLVMSTNLESTFHLSQLAHPLLKASGNGSIVFISSIGAFIAVDGLSVYCASKGAVNQLTRSLACEWPRDNIRTNCVAPGTIKTPLIEHVKFQSLIRAVSLCSRRTIVESEKQKLSD